MRKILLTAAALFAGCGGSAVDVTGTWSGIVTSTAAGTFSATLSANQSGSGVSGTYSTSYGGVGSVSGTMDGNALHFTVTVSNYGCPGSLTGIGTVDATGTHMAVSYSGSTACGGYESGTGNLSKQ